jgi:hypothetical protein
MPYYGQAPNQPAGNQPYAQQPPYQAQYSQQPGPYSPQSYPQQNYPQQNYPQAVYGQQPGYGQQGMYGNQQQNYPAPPPVPASLTIPQGTYVTVRINQLLSSDKNQPGDSFSSTLVDPVVVNGIVVAEPGETVAGRVVLWKSMEWGRPLNWACS